jgi:hypothetical protein
MENKRHKFDYKFNFYCERGEVASWEEAARSQGFPSISSWGRFVLNKAASRTVREKVTN